MAKSIVIAKKTTKKSLFIFPLLFRSDSRLHNVTLDFNKLDVCISQKVYRKNGLFIVHIGLILPLGVLDRLWFYCLGLLLEFISIYFFVVSIWYWVVTNIR